MSSGFPGSVLRKRLAQIRLARIIVGAVLALSLGLSLALTAIMGSSRIDVGLDLLSAPEGRPTLRWGSGREDARQMEPVSPAFSPTKSFFELTATGQKNSVSRRSQIWFWLHDGEWGRNEMEEVEFDPKTPWMLKPRKAGDFWVFYGQTPSVARWSGYEVYGVCPTLTLLAEPTSGKAVLRTLEKERPYDLYWKSSSSVDVPLPRIVLSRYHARIPRRALSSLRIVFPGEGRPAIGRLYLGTWVPRLFFAEEKYPCTAWGWIAENWAPRIEDGAVVLPSLARLEQGGAATFAGLFLAFALVLGAAAALAWAGVWLIRFLAAPPERPRELQPFRILPYLLLFLPMFLMCLFYMLVFFPGTMTVDSLWAWGLVHPMRLDDGDPLLWLLTMRFVTLLWDSPGAVVLLHMLSISLVSAYVFSLLLRAGVPKTIVLFFYAAHVLSPRNSMMGVALWKDILYSVAVCLLTAVLVHVQHRRPQDKRIGPWIPLGLALGLPPLLRYNGLAILAVVTPLLPVFFWPWKRGALAAAGVALALYGAITLGVPRIVPVTNRFMNYSRMMSFAGIRTLSPLVDQDVPMSQTDYDFLSKVRPFRDRWKYSPFDSSGTTSTQYVSLDFTRDHIDRFMETMSTLLRRYPLAYLRSLLQYNSHIYWIPQPGDSPLACITIKIRSNSQGLRLDSVFPLLYSPVSKRLYDSMNDKRINWLLWRPALSLWLIVLSAAVLLLRTREYRFLIAYAPVILSALSIFIAGPNMCLRYLLPQTYAAGFLICLGFLPKTARPRESPPPAPKSEAMPSLSGSEEGP